MAGPLPIRLDPEVINAYRVGDDTDDVIISIGDGKASSLHRLTRVGAESLLATLYMLGYKVD